MGTTDRTQAVRAHTDRTHAISKQEALSAVFTSRSSYATHEPRLLILVHFGCARWHAACGGWAFPFGFGTPDPPWLPAAREAGRTEVGRPERRVAEIAVRKVDDVAVGLGVEAQAPAQLLVVRRMRQLSRDDPLVDQRCSLDAHRRRAQVSQVCDACEVHYAPCAWFE